MARAAEEEQEAELERKSQRSQLNPSTQPVQIADRRARQVLSLQLAAEESFETLHYQDSQAVESPWSQEPIWISDDGGESGKNDQGGEESDGEDDGGTEEERGEEDSLVRFNLIPVQKSPVAHESQREKSSRSNDGRLLQI